jgi:hypothetical protein
MTLPFELLWGVDVAVKKLRPNAHFQLEGTSFTVWEDANGEEPPAWEEVMAQIAADQKAAEEWQQNNT